MSQEPCEGVSGLPVVYYDPGGSGGLWYATPVWRCRQCGGRSAQSAEWVHHQAWCPYIKGNSVEIRTQKGDVLVEVEGETLVDADLECTDLSEADLWGANLTRANLERARLVGANLTRANLTRANLWGANLTRASLEGANLAGANLRMANFLYANLWEANLEGADLLGTQLGGAYLSGARGIMSANFDVRGHTLVLWLQDGKVRVTAGCRHFTLEQAMAHWGSKQYPVQARGDLYVKMILAMAPVLLGLGDASR